MFYHNHVVGSAKKMIDHVKKHHHKYLFFIGLAGGAFLFMKIIMLFGASYMLYNASNDATFADDFVISGSVDTGIIDTGTISTGFVNTGLVNTGVIDTGSVDTGTINTGIIDTGTISTGFVNTGLNYTGIAYSYENIVLECNYSGFSSNISGGKLYSGIIDLSWTISPSCTGNLVDIELYDHNENRISLANVSGTVTQYNFDTRLLGSGYYFQTGLNSSGEIVTVSSGIYSGVSMSSWTGYRLRWLVQPDTILKETQDFAIDNKKPIISNVSLSYSGASSGMVGIGKSISLSFSSSEQLTGIRVSVNSGEATLSQLSGYNYLYTVNLSGSLYSSYINYIIYYQDLVGNVGYNSGISNLFYDSVSPQMTGFSLSGYNFSFATSKLTSANVFVLIKNTTNGWAFSMTGFSTGHLFSLPTLSMNTYYDVGIVVKDQAGNEGKAAFALKRNSSGDISFTLLATLYGGVLTNYSSGVSFLSTGSSQITVKKELVVEKFKEEINKFTDCKNDIQYTKIKLQIKGVEIGLNMPLFRKDEMKKLVNSFVLYILKNLEKEPLSEIELKDIAQNFDGFLVILKLIKDDNNLCKQNLSNYHLEQFQQSLDAYGVDL